MEPIVMCQCHLRASKAWKHCCDEIKKNEANRFWESEQAWGVHEERAEFVVWKAIEAIVVVTALQHTKVFIEFNRQRIQNHVYWVIGPKHHPKVNEQAERFHKKLSARIDKAGNDDAAAEPKQAAAP